MHDARLSLTRQVTDDLKSHFGSLVLKTVIPRNVKLAEAPSHGKPILEYDIRSKGAQSYLGLARELFDRARRRRSKVHRKLTPSQCPQSQLNLTSAEP